MDEVVVVESLAPSIDGITPHRRWAMLDRILLVSFVNCWRKLMSHNRVRDVQFIRL